jgi:hypothetical protein
MEFKGQRYSIWIEAEAWAPGQWTPIDDNSDAMVTFESGERWVASFFSYRNILSLAHENVETGECLGGKYFVATDMILVDEVSRQRIEDVIADLLESDGFRTYFTRCADGPRKAPSVQSVYLGTLDEVVSHLDDELATEQLAMLVSVLGKLGFQLMSGTEPAFHELWAAPIVQTQAHDETSRPILLDPSASRDESATDFERQFLAWLHVTFDIFPAPRQGTNAAWWTLEYNNSTVGFVIVRRAAAQPQASAIDWLLRVEETEGAGFIERVARYFRTGSGIRRRMPTGEIRIQFKSNDLVHRFDDQSDCT